MLKRLIALLILAWVAGFAWFAMALPQPHQGGKTDAAVALTGGEGRITRGLMALDKGLAKRLLVSGVDRSVKPREFAALHKIKPGTMACCITLDFKSVDTTSNAREAARWIAANKIKSVRLITTDWHMRRAALEFERFNSEKVSVIRDAVASRPAFGTLLREYHKLLARWIAQLWGG